MNIIFALIIVALLCVVILLMTAALTLALIGGLMTGVPFVAAPRRTAEALGELCKLDATSVFYDLGCGDGRFVAGLATQYPKAKCIGVECAPLPSLLLWLRMRLSTLPNMRFMYKNFAEVNLADATHIYVYLFPHIMERLLPKLTAELRPGTRVVSCDFVFKSRAPSAIVPLDTTKHPHKLYVYDF